MFLLGCASLKVFTLKSRSSNSPALVSLQVGIDVEISQNNLLQFCIVIHNLPGFLTPEVPAAVQVTLLMKHQDNERLQTNFLEFLIVLVRS